MTNTVATAESQSPPYLKGRLVLFTTVTAVAVAGSRFTSSTHLVLPFALAAISIAVWHGAFDGVLAQEVFEPLWGAHWRPLFYAAYLGLVTLVLVLWWAAPAVALPCFLLYSAFHFGTEGERSFSAVRAAVGTATGFLPIAAACHWWPHEVAAIFADMLRGGAAYGTAMTSIAGDLLWPAAVVAILGARWTKVGWRLFPFLLVGTELVLFRWCAPVTAFAIFFCIWHTPEHMLSTSLDRAGTFQSRLLSQHLRSGVGPWLASLLALFLACCLGRHTVQVYTGAFFVFLSALTVPHMLLAEMCRRQAKFASDASGATHVSQSTVTQP